MNDILNELVDYTLYHFHAEEEIIESKRYPKIVEHIEEHKYFFEKITELRKDALKNNILLSLKTIDFLKDWTINHILGSDMEFSEYMKEIEGVYSHKTAS